MYNNFVLPFVFGVIFLFGTIAYKYTTWFLALSKSQKKLVGNSFFSVKSFKAVIEIIKESLLHISIFKHNRLLGYMHSSLAFGWFLLILVGSIEVDMVLGERSPLYVHIFFKYFHPVGEGSIAEIFTQVMDLLLLIVLSGVSLALYKRLSSRSMGMKKTSKHTLGDKLALTALWYIFPIRLLAESITAGVHNSGGFLTGTIGRMLSNATPNLISYELPAWWAYSFVLCAFFMAMPFSRYMHILTEIPHIFLRFWGVKTEERVSESDNFQVHACSRCGICIDPCQMQSVLNVNSMQGVYFLRDRREDKLGAEQLDNCMMCGRCELKCPVNIDINALRLASKAEYHNYKLSAERYAFLSGKNNIKSVEKEVGYFAGCMTLISPAIIHSMNTIFSAANIDVWLVDKEGGVCCGRPLKLSGDIEGAKKMFDFNRELFINSGVKLLITSCPICLKTFKEDYKLDEVGIEVLHHSQYIDRLITEGKLTVKKSDLTVTYHDPCELGRGLKIYDEPRSVIERCANLLEMTENREHALCCGHSLANNKILHLQKAEISDRVTSLAPSKLMITSCPQCKSGFLSNNSEVRVMDISELIVKSIKS